MFSDKESENEPAGTFDNFCETQKPTENEIHETIEDIKPIETLNLELKCEFCGYKPRKHAKNQEKALADHIKKCGKKPKETILLNVEPKKQNVVALIQDVEVLKDIGLPLDEQKKKLIEDLEVLKHKFQDITYKPSYSYPETSLETLQRIKNTYIRIISDKAGSSTAFNMIVMGARGMEKITSSLGVADLDGFSSDIRSKDEEILPIIKEMIDLGIIESTAISPEVKLMLVLGNVAVARMERNRIEKNGESAERN